MQGLCSPSTSSYFSTLPFGSSGSWTWVCPSLDLSALEVMPASPLSAPFVWDPPFPGGLWSVPCQGFLFLCHCLGQGSSPRSPPHPLSSAPGLPPCMPPGLSTPLLKRTWSCLSHKLV